MKNSQTTSEEHRAELWTYPVVVVEPHADDAFLSLGWHIEHWRKHGLDVTILTMFATDRRSMETKEWADRLGCKHATIFLEEKEHVILPRKEYLDNEFEFRKLTDKLAFRLHELPFLRLTKPSIILLPVGIKHREHKATRSLWDAFRWKLRARVPEPKLYFLQYADIPYYLTQTNHEAMYQRIERLRVASLVMPHARKMRFSSIFKSQSLFFRFNEEKVKRMPELILFHPTGGFPDGRAWSD